MTTTRWTVEAQGSLAARLGTDLRDQIVAATLRPGDLVLEQDLARDYGVSKTPVREALQMLVHEGWLSVLPRRGYVVSSMGFSDLREVMDLRIIIEPGLAAAAARLGGAPLREELDDILEAQIGAPEPRDAVLAARRFHTQVATAARNDRALRIMEGLWDETSRAHALLPLESYIGDDCEHSGHRRVLDAITAGEPDHAEEAMRAHLREAAEAMVRAFYG